MGLCQTLHSGVRRFIIALFGESFVQARSLWYSSSFTERLEDKIPVYSSVIRYPGQI